MGPKIDVVVVSYNSRSTLRECVEPLAHLNEIYVVVVDNASLDGSPETVADLPIRPQIRPTGAPSGVIPELAVIS